VSKKDLERWQQLIASQKSHAHAASQTRQERIKVLWGIKEQDPKAKALKRRRLKELLDSVRTLTEDLTETVNSGLVDRVSELVELAALQDLEIEYLTEFAHDWERIHAQYPEHLENLRIQSLTAELRPLEEKLLAEWETPKREYELKRRRRRGNLIENEFARAREPWLRRSALPPISASLSPTCLDAIFEGDDVNMIGLQELFGMHRNRFPKKLPKFKRGRETLYDYRAVVKIMAALLGEESPKRKRPTRGRARQRWLGKPDLRRRVLGGIETRINSFGSPEQIKAEFLTIIHHHVSDSAKK
jgi:hypothetical protein